MTDVAKFTFTWMIENFNLFPPKVGERLESHNLFLNQFLNSNWFLLLYPGGSSPKSAGHVSVFHCRTSGGPEIIETDFIVSINGSKKKSVKDSIKKNSNKGWNKFMERKLVKEFNVLIVECHMQMSSNRSVEIDDIEESTHYLMPCFSKSQFMIPEIIEETSLAVEKELSATRKALRLFCNQGFVRTRVSVEKRILTCAIKDYLGPDSERKQHIPIVLPSATVVITLLMTKNSNSDLLEIEICVKNERKLHCMLICKIELIDSERNIHITAEEEHLFEEEDNNRWKFEQPFNWNDIKGKKEASLRFTLTFADGQYFSDIEWTNEVDDCVGSLNFHNKVSKDLHRLFIEKKLCDVTVRVQDKCFEAHKTVLASRSPVFAAMFESGMKENNTNVIEIDDLDWDTVSQILKFMYTGIIEEINAANAMQLFSAADKYQILTLKDICKSILQNNLTLKNICFVLLLADAHSDDSLLESCITFLFYHRKDILESKEWQELKENNVCLALKILTKVCMRSFS